ncbi:hypothetical protein IQ235_00055 [Oscillatoriales cyanobacterium LEGE 11467]|uniref:Uncharacterized protein n=1 Tax=Zarconia navalis LEGE 11467 TaxID=1828826 RepID=A0A928Z5D2_9CYAN|nr:hypothetical protein [Zarconia navalis LEGE 11467]
MTELLVSIIIASLIVVGLLSLVVELLTTDARETARTETQREMQMALDYISTDIREAVYVYDGQCLVGQNNCSGIFAQQYVPVPQNSVPILAFWRLDPLPDALINQCATSTAETPLRVGNQTVPCLQGRMYTLVVYHLTRQEEGKAWQGLARIQRYTLPQFDRRGQVVTGYADPTDATTFVNWPLDDDGRSAANGSPNLQGRIHTLVDFVDSRPMNEIPEIQDTSPEVNCPPNYQLTPSDEILAAQSFPQMRNFYACVLLPAQFRVQQSTGAFNQKVILFIRGNAKGKPGIDTVNEGFMPTIATQVLNRGVRNKAPSQ